MELRRYWEVFWRRKHLFAFITGGVIFLTLILAFTATPVYRASTKVLIKTQDITTSLSSTVPQSQGKFDYTINTNIPGTVREMIENNDSLRRMIEELNLLKKNGKPFSGLELMDSSLVNLFINKTGVKITQISESDVIQITGLSKDPAVAVKISNTLTSNFLKMLENLNREEIGKTIDLLTKESSRLKSLVEDSEEIVKQYKLRNMAINIDDMATSYTSQLVSTELSIAKMTAEKKEEHPDLRAALKQIALIKEELHDITLKQVELARLQRINIALSNVYTSILSDLEKARVLKSMSITNMLVIENAQIPETSKKLYIYFPKKKIMLFLALIIGSFMGIIVVFFAEYLDDTIKNPEELKAWTGQKVLATIPLLKNTELFPPKKSTPIFTAVSDLWLSIKIEAKNQDDPKHPRMLTVTSYGDKEGKSLVAANLGLLLSGNGYKTLIVDFNLTNSFLSELYTQPHEKRLPEKGLADFIASSKVNAASALEIFKKLDNNLYFLPTGLTDRHEIALIKSSPHLFELIELAKKDFDVVVVDASPLNSSKETFLIAKESDATVLVVEAGRYQLEHIRWAIDELNETGVFIAGAVLNKLKYPR